MGTFIIVLAVMFFLLAAMGTWGIATGIYQDAIEEPIVEPILRLLASNKTTSLLLFIPVCTAFMCLRRTVTYFPAWFFVWMCMSAYGYPSDYTYRVIGFFILCAGIIKMASSVKEYFPDAKAYKRPFDDDFLNRF